MAPVSGSDQCFTHAPERAQERAKARKRGGQARETPHLYPLPKTPGTLRDVESIQTALEQVVHETLAQRNGHERSRAIGSLLMIALKALETGEMESRLRALEERLATMQPRRTA
jgi:hypothetical protein